MRNEPSLLSSMDEVLCKEIGTRSAEDWWLGQNVENPSDKYPFEVEQMAALLPGRLGAMHAARLLTLRTAQHRWRELLGDRLREESGS